MIRDCGNRVGCMPGMEKSAEVMVVWDRIGETVRA